jgi:hypothetical protein
MRRGGAVVGAIFLLAGGEAVLSTKSEYLPRQLQAAEEAPTPTEEKAVLEQRAKEYWEARLKGDLDRAFTLENPVQQKTMGKERYRKNIDSAFKWQKVEVLQTEILAGGELADITIDVQYQAPIADKMITVTSQKKDNWQRFEGTWYHVLDFLLLPDGKRPVIPGTNPKGA